MRRKALALNSLRRSLAPARYVGYSPSDPTYWYGADIPRGNGWSDPIESRPTGGALLRTTVRGPGGAFLIIDRTPSEEPQLGGGFDSSRSVSHPTFGSATEYIISSSSEIPECSGASCVDYLIRDGRGGGWGVLAGGPILALATEVASSVADSVETRPVVPWRSSNRHRHGSGTDPRVVRLSTTVWRGKRGM